MPVKKIASKKKKEPISESIGKDVNGKGETKQKGKAGIIDSKKECRVGMSKGVTINLGNYESAKISVWMERVVDNDEHTVNENVQEISAYLDDVLAIEIEGLKK